MSVPFEEAKGLLVSMFPSIEEETLVEILKSNNGHMETTVEMLLELSGEGSQQPSASSQAFNDGGSRGGGEETSYPVVEDDEALARRLQAMGGLTEDEILARQLAQMTTENDEAIARRMQAAFSQGMGQAARPRGTAAWNEEDYREDYNGSWEPIAPDSQREIRARDLAGSVVPDSSYFNVSFEDMKKKLGTMSDAAKRQMQDFVDAFYEDRDEDMRQGADGSRGDYQRVAPSQHRYALDDDVAIDQNAAQVLVADRENQNLQRRAGNHEFDSDDDAPVTAYPADRKAIKMKPMRSTPLHGDAKDD